LVNITNYEALHCTVLLSHLLFLHRILGVS